ncbi:hypothetical protein PSI22_04010 [Xenorhabdus sp. XENO-7]|uniref:Uncharacterized protein n=1 Tax=Xenorhabdus aichiensis TaxID=3025874 RepID=A0ABT5LZG1_9GAMM|nr:hypothetical protein [Xenorhabdus aichiensis]MDC9620813.1 hypothetical protein [Xenorhabdus aichiensis]
MFDDIINKTNESINYPIEKYSLSPKFNDLSTEIRDDLLDVKNDPGQYNRFCKNQSRLLSVLDNKALAHSKNWEIMISDSMTGTLPFSGDEASAVDKMKNYYIERNHSLYFDEKVSRAILNKEGVFSAILNSDKDTVSIIERTPRYFYNLEFYRPKGFERYQLATKERYDTNLNLYKFSSWHGER